MALTEEELAKISQLKSIFAQFRQTINTLKNTQNTVIKQAIERIDREHAEQILNQLKQN